MGAVSVLFQCNSEVLGPAIGLSMNIVADKDPEKYSTCPWRTSIYLAGLGVSPAKDDADPIAPLY